jgi:hypothetical protein
MKKILLLIQIIVGLSNFSFAQSDLSDVSLAGKIIRLKINPSTTDPTIKIFDSPHLVIYNTSIKQGKLLLFMCGTGGIPEKGPDELFATAIRQGYRVISLSYIDVPAVSNTCIGENLTNKQNCAEEFRIKRIYGENTTPLIPDEPQDAIMNRFTKLLIYLADSDKQRNWGMYLENGVPKWDQIALSGQSQGGGMAAFIAKRVLVARVITFSGGWDYSAKNKIADWYFQNSATPPDRWYGTYNIAEPAANTIAETYKAMAIPDNHIYPLKLDVRSGKLAHVEGIKNTAYVQQWIELLGVGN